MTIPALAAGAATNAAVNAITSINNNCKYCLTLIEKLICEDNTDN